MKKNYGVFQFKILKKEVKVIESLKGCHSLNEESVITSMLSARGISVPLEFQLFK